MIKWTDMIDPIYTLVNLVEIDPNEVKVVGISIMDTHMSVWYEDAKGIPRHKTVRYEL
jgi:hypothetical protein